MPRARWWASIEMTAPPRSPPGTPSPAGHERKHPQIGKPLVTAVPMIWLVLFFMVPFIIVFGISFSQSVLAIPPYEPLWSWVDDKVLALRLHLANYDYLFTDTLYVSSYLYSLKVA